MHNFFANLLSGKLAGLTSIMENVQIFGTIWGELIVFAIMLFILRKKLVKLMALDEFKNK